MKEVSKTWTQFDERTKTEKEISETFLLRKINVSEEAEIMKFLRDNDLKLTTIHEDMWGQRMLTIELVSRAIVTPEKYRKKEEIGKMDSKTASELMNECLELWFPSDQKKEKSAETSSSSAEQSELSQ